MRENSEILEDDSNKCDICQNKSVLKGESLCLTCFACPEDLFEKESGKTISKTNTEITAEIKTTGDDPSFFGKARFRCFCTTKHDKEST